MNNFLPGVLIGIVLSFLVQYALKEYKLLPHQPQVLPVIPVSGDGSSITFEPVKEKMSMEDFYASLLPAATPMPENISNLCLDYPEHLKTVWSPDGRSYIFVDVVAKSCGWKVLKNHSNATLLWTTGYSDMPKDVLASLRLGAGQIWSQLRDGWHLADKAKLHRLLKRVKHLEYQPETYILSDPAECVAFFKAAKANPEVIWVTKLPSASQGDGIVVNPPLQTLLDTWQDTTSSTFKCKKASKEDILAQRYVLNPLLLEGKKMEIRSYWVIASTDPLVVLYRDGTVRLTTRNYEHGDWDNPLIHITNTKQQKKADPNYYATEQERKWTLEQLAAYLKNQGKFVESEEEWLDQLRDKFFERIAVSALGAYPLLLADRGAVKGWDGRYELFGMDIILDDNLGLWLTELQDGPSLSRDPGVKEYVIPALIQEMVDIILEIDTTLRLKNEKLPFPLTSVKQWRQIDLRKYIHLIPDDQKKPDWSLNQ